MKENEQKTLLRSSDDLIAAVEQYGFLPFFRNEIHGFSIEELCPPELWFADDVDVIYFTGGNSFFLMDQLRKTGTDGLLKKELANGKLMIGESAGAIICAPSIQYIEQMDEKPEDYSQEDDAGIDLIDFYVLPHYLTAPFKKVTEKIMTEFSDLNLCPINNRQGIVIDGEDSKVICKD